MPYAPLVLFAAMYAYATFVWSMPLWVGAVYLVASLACFLSYSFDKSAARAGRRRTPESTLLMMGLACGWPGAILAQQWLRHKSAKQSFRLPFHVTVALNIVAFGWLAAPPSILR